MSAPFVPANNHQLAGYLAEIVKHAAKQYPGDESFARGVAAIEALDARGPVEVNPDRKCRYCAATSGLTMVRGDLLELTPMQWQCWDDCKDSAR